MKLSNKSKVWWNKTKKNEDLLIRWLKRQYTGERKAAIRLKQVIQLAKKRGISPYRVSDLRIIAVDEAVHCVWIGKLLKNRGIKPPIISHKDRYWSSAMPENMEDYSMEELFAIGAHAEEMRLSRIKAIASDVTCPHDIRETFKLILRDEEIHAKTFRLLTSDRAYRAQAKNHKVGKKMLGLES